MPARRKGRVVNEAIDFAEAAESFSGDLRRTFRILKITLHKGRVFRSKFASEGIGSFDITSVENDLGSFLHKKASHRGADPGGAASNEDDLVLKSHNYFVFCFELEAFLFFGVSSFVGLGVASAFD